MAKWVNGIGKRGNQYWIRYPDGKGGRIEEPAKTTRKDEAKELRASRIAAIREGTLFPGQIKRKQRTMEDLHKMWMDEKKKKKDIENDRKRLQVAVDFFSPKRLLSTITDIDVLDYKKHLEGRPGQKKDTLAATATVNRHLAVLRGAFNLATKRRWAHQNPMEAIDFDDENNERDRICSHEEYRRLISFCESSDFRALITAAYWLGWRLGELCELKRSQIYNGILRLTSSNTKEKGSKSIPMPPEVKAAFDILPEHPSGRVFLYHRSTYSTWFIELCGKAGIKNLHFHDLRHTAVTNLIEADVDLLTIQTITGHKSLHMIKRYAHLSNQRRAAALEKVRIMLNAPKTAVPWADFPENA